jgi:hypothetical protein
MAAKGESPYLFGMHDLGAQDIMTQAGRKGWVLITEGIGRDPGNVSGGDYHDLAEDGFGVMVRLNHGYSTAGTLPHSQFYDDFATRCGNFVHSSTGCHIWIIGNETNLRAERPEHGSPQEEVITPERYARCYRKCRAAIRSRSGHGNDLVLVSPVAPYNDETKYPGNERGDWVKYQQDVLALLGPGNYDGVAIHAYTHGNTPDLITHDLKMASFPDRQYDFKTYQDTMAVIPPGVPVYMTEANPQSRPGADPSGWPDGSAPNGWVQAAYREIHGWNQTHPDRQIRSLILYRWGADITDQPLWTIHNRSGVIKDFQRALAHDYQWGLPPRPDYRVAFLTQETPATVMAGGTISVHFRLRNDGAKSWLRDGPNPFRLGSHWYHAATNQEVAVGTDFRSQLPADVPPDGEVELTATVMAPDTPGNFRLRWDMVHEGVTWFTSQGDQGQIVPVEVLPSEVEIAVVRPVQKPLIEDISGQLPTHATLNYPTRNREEISAIILHHSAVPPSVEAEQIARYQVERKGWPGIGFHFFVRGDGSLQQTQPLEVVSNHAGDTGNRVGVGVCLAGNFTDQPPLGPQLITTASLVAWLLNDLNLPLEAIQGHSDYVVTQCPGNTWDTTWHAQLVARVKDALAGAVTEVGPIEKTLGHYLLFWQTVDDWARDDWRNAEKYVERFRVTMGFSADDAMQAEYVTIVGGPLGVSLEVEASLMAAGCRVERVAGETTAETKALLDDLAAKGQRFLKLQ